VIGTLISLLKAKAMISLKEEIEQITLEAETATYLCLTDEKLCCHSPTLIGIAALMCSVNPKI
jgi:hypothetical protein